MAEQMNVEVAQETLRYLFNGGDLNFGAWHVTWQSLGKRRGPKTKAGRLLGTQFLN